MSPDSQEPIAKPAGSPASPPDAPCAARGPHRFPERTPVDPTRVRTLPAHFAWVDHRLRERLHELSLEEIALLFFLHLVADRQGLSFWADSTIARKLGLKEGEVIQARYALLHRGLIAYRYPLFQLLPLPERDP